MSVTYVVGSAPPSPKVTLQPKGAILYPTEHGFENQAVLNPACIERNGEVHMYYRAVRQGNFSTIGYCKLRNNTVIYRASAPVLAPEFEYESHGIEDPRIVQCEDTYYLLYTAFDGLNARIAYAHSSDLEQWTKGGIISAPLLYKEAAELCRSHESCRVYDFFQTHYQEHPHASQLLLYEKDALLFPRKIKGKFAMVHRIFPDIQLIYFNDFADLTADYWRDNLRSLESHTLLRPQYWFENRHIGGGCPPVETEEGWLFIYHAVEDTPTGRVYHAALALLDLDDPTRVIGRLDYPLFSPEEAWELNGDVNNVVFPSGTVVENNDLHIFYGAADTCIGVKTVHIPDLLSALRCTIKKDLLI